MRIAVCDDEERFRLDIKKHIDKIDAITLFIYLAH